MTGALLAAVLAASPASERDCFRHHLEEAIALNLSRRRRYADLSAGASIPVSDRLVAAERLSLVVAIGFDLAARPYQERGIPLLCAEFVPMSGAEAAPPETPPVEVAAAPPAGPAGSSASSPWSGDAPARGSETLDAAALRARLERAFDSGGFHRLRWAAEFELLALEPAPERHCMVRHLVESVRRAAALAPEHAADARAAGLPSPLRLSGQLVRLHLWALDAAAELDADAAPLQAAGVPILCADLPRIPAP